MQFGLARKMQYHYQQYGYIEYNKDYLGLAKPNPEILDISYALIYNCVSRNYDSTDLEKLKAIYKNLLFVKNEIFSNI
jgi:hypothetical protein